jgi:hypothetical protein
MKNWLKQNLIAIDQLFNTFFGGWADETISARSYRLQDESKKWKIVRVTIDMLFFWEEDHCENAWASEMMRRQMPVEYREGFPSIFKE